MPGTVTFNGTNVTLAEVGDDAAWDDDGTGPGSAQSSDLPIQGLQARGRRVDNADKGSSYDATTGVDLSSNGTHVGAWLVALQPAQVTRGSMKLGGGSDAETTPWSQFDRFDGTNPYPSRGGWQRSYVSAQRVADAVSGTLNLASVRQFGHKFNMGDVGGTTPNVQQDRTDYLTGGGPYLTVDGGTAPSPASIQDFVAADPDNSSNVYGGVTVEDAGVSVHVRLGIADATATIYVDDAETVTFANQPLASGDWLGLLIDLQNASTTIDMNNGLIQSSPGAVNKGDLVVTGTSGTFDTDGENLKELRRICLTSACTLAGLGAASCGQIDPTNGDYTGQQDLPGTDEYVDTQENLDLSSTSGDFELILRVAPDDWTPSATETLASHYGGSIATESFRFQLLTTAVLRLIVSDGSAETTLDSNAVTAVNGAWCWIRVVYDQSAGQASFFESGDPADTPPGDITWVTRGTPTGTSRSIPSLTRPFLIGAENDATPANFFTGLVSYAELWTDGERAPGATLGDLIFIADWRTGPDFTAGTRSDDFDAAGITWEEQGTAPVYTQGDDNTGAATLAGATIRNSTSEGSILWNANTDPAGELDDLTLVSDGTGHGLVFHPNSPATVTLNDHSYSGFAVSDGSTGNETLYNNTGGALTVIVSGGDTPTVRDGTGASTTIQASISVTISPIEAGTEVRFYRVSDGVEDDGIENSIGSSFVASVTASVAYNIVVLKPGKIDRRLENKTYTANTSVDPFQLDDLNFNDPP